MDKVRTQQYMSASVSCSLHLPLLLRLPIVPNSLSGRRDAACTVLYPHPQHPQQTIRRVIRCHPRVHGTANYQHHQQPSAYYLW